MRWLDRLQLNLLVGAARGLEEKRAEYPEEVAKISALLWEAANGGAAPSGAEIVTVQIRFGDPFVAAKHTDWTDILYLDRERAEAWVAVEPSTRRIKPQVG